MMKYIKLLRVKHYLKNFLIFIPLFFSGKPWLTAFPETALGFLCFCMTASAIYIINDIFDAPNDRLHPVKRNRPIASGAVPVRNACVIVAVLVALSAVVSVLTFRPWAASLLALYFLLNLGYSFGLKNTPLLDVCILVSGFVIRIIFGGMLSDTPISAWMYLTILSVSFFFAFGKRKNELRLHGDSGTRKVLSGYAESFLEKNMYVCMGLSNGFYALWAMESASPLFAITIPCVLVLTMRYSMIIENFSEGDPVSILTGDMPILCLGVIYIFIAFLALYVMPGR